MAIIKVKVKPNAKKQAIERKDDLFIVYLKEKPRRGEANKALIKAIANFFNVSTARVRIIKGYKSREKFIEIT